MNRGSDPAATDAAASLPPASPGEGEQAELDLDRLVWDPEYREAMRPRLRRIR